MRVNTVCVTTMKRFIVATILTVVIVGVLAHFMPRDFTEYLGELDANATVTIYCRQTNLDGIDMGGGCVYKVQCTAANFFATAAQCHNIDGVSVSFDGSFEDVTALLQFFRLQVSSEFEQDGLYVVCGRSGKIQNGVFDGSQVVNLQIAYRNGVVHIGSPLILGDY